MKNQSKHWGPLLYSRSWNRIYYSNINLGIILRVKDGFQFPFIYILAASPPAQALPKGSRQPTGLGARSKGELKPRLQRAISSRPSADSLYHTGTSRQKPHLRRAKHSASGNKTDWGRFAPGRKTRLRPCDWMMALGAREWKPACGGKNKNRFLINLIVSYVGYWAIYPWFQIWRWSDS